MGRIVRRFARFWQQELRHSLRIGEQAVPLVMTTLDQRALEISLEATAALAVAGTVQAAYLETRTAVTIVGNLRTARIQAIVSGIGVVPGDVRAAYIRALVLDTGEVTGEFTGLFIELNTPLGATLGDVYAIHVGNMVRVTPGTQYDILRVDENGGGDITNLISAHIAGGSDIEFFFHFAQDRAAWGNAGGDRTAGSATNANGWLRVSTGGGVRYIQLFN